MISPSGFPMLEGQDRRGHGDSGDDGGSRLSGEVPSPALPIVPAGDPRAVSEGRHGGSDEALEAYGLAQNTPQGMATL